MAVILIRHPETVDPRIIAGQSEIALAPHAVARLDTLVDTLPSARRVVSSDLSRCRTLAEKLARRANVMCRIDPRWREQSFGAWEGKTWDQVNGRAYLETWTTATPPGGESIADVQARVAAALRDVEDGTVVVTHAGPIRCALALSRGLRIEDAFAMDVGFGSWRAL